MANKVKFGLKNVYWAKVYETVTSTGTSTTYGSMKAWTGAVNLTLDAAGSDDSNFDADDGVYYVVQGVNSGYTGSFESALIPDEVKTDVLGNTTDTNGVMVEKNTDKRTAIALAFEIDGDVKAARYLLYKATLARPSLNASTKTSDGGATPQTDTVNITVSPRPDDGKIRAWTTSTTSSGTYEGWFSAVYEGA